MYLIISAFLVPKFGAFDYYFLMDEVKLPKSTHKLLGLFGSLYVLCATHLFSRYFKDKEYKNLIMLEAMVKLAFAPLTMLFISRFNVKIGIPDEIMVIFTSAIHVTTTQCLIFLPLSVIMTKICPKHIEATSFALLASVSNLTSSISSWSGTWINDNFVGVTTGDMSHYWVLAMLSLAFQFLPLLFINMIPTR